MDEFRIKRLETFEKKKWKKVYKNDGRLNPKSKVTVLVLTRVVVNQKKIFNGQQTTDGWRDTFRIPLLCLEQQAFGIVMVNSEDESIFILYLYFVLFASTKLLKLNDIYILLRHAYVLSDQQAPSDFNN